MGVLGFDTTQGAVFNPISSQLAALPNGGGTWVAIIASNGGGSPGDIVGLTDGAGAIGAGANWYHTLTYNPGFGGAGLVDDDGLVGVGDGAAITFGTDWWLVAVTWPSGGAALERFHQSKLASPAWTHTNATGNNGGNRAGPSTSAGQLNLGFNGDKTNASLIAVVGAWNVALTDVQIEALLTSLKTSDLWNSGAGEPVSLIECTSTAPTDIGANPSTFKTITSGVTAGGTAPPGWTFDGRGSAGSEVDGSAALSAAVGLAASGKVAHTGSAALSATFSLEARASGQTGSAALTATVSLTASGSVVGAGPAITGEADLAATVGLSASGEVAHTGSAALGSTVALNATGKVTRSSSAALSSAVGLSASGNVAHTGSADLGVTVALTASGSTDETAVTGSAALSASTSLAASAVVLHRGAASLGATAALSASGRVNRTGHAALAATASLGASGKVNHTGHTALTVTLHLSARVPGTGMDPLTLPVSAHMDAASKTVHMDAAAKTATLDPHETGAKLDA